MTQLRFSVYLLLLVTAGAVTSNHSYADTLQPGYLEFSQQDATLWQLSWKAPVQSGANRPASPKIPAACTLLNESDSWLRPKNYTQPNSSRLRNTKTWQVSCEGSLDGESLGIQQLPLGFSEVIARVQFLGGPIQTHRLTNSAPTISLSNTQQHDSVILAYLLLGYEHILEGYDHILFVLCLVLLVLQPWGVIKTVTTFTVAHSLTLALLTQGWVTVDRSLVEVLIALSIVVLAAEVANKEKKPAVNSMRPAIIAAFMFGLLHGLGFAGALSEIGLPQGESLVALLGFNIGVELGQLCIVAVIMSLLWAINKYFKRGVAWRISRLASSVSGIIGAYWVFERLLA
ncbi:MAG: HupE/UreJ family protein [Gammaproteobacteria bacterium]|nr:HupE/UreJ family protein [Gammaproteobacteria bacterium]NND39524.1 HupE/UreJ family protein [Pseudomonadales bacterium]MBT8151956.1 HupE/UreJ family protein [Gammaproteobacteria bacterium]NNL11972.1 HupE/UreJ family protein [Pseudomonadales bacterium]NNM11861.1 HupE/UreJ family protein [Pseudomonadales bacterium]